MNSSELIPARGTVEFILHPMEDDEFDIDGPMEWARPAVGLMLPYFCDERDITRSLRAESLWERRLPHEPVVVDEIGCSFMAHDYLGNVMGRETWEDGSYFYRPHIDGPIADAPRVWRLSTEDQREHRRPVIRAMKMVSADPVRFGLPDNDFRVVKDFVDSRDAVWWEAHMGDILQASDSPAQAEGNR